MIDTDNPGRWHPSIPAHSRRQAMDWGLVLVSQGIAATITLGEEGWELVVEPNELEQAEAIIEQYLKENRHWRWRGELPGTNLVFHWGSAWWVLGIAVFYYWSAVRLPGMKEAGMVEDAAVRHGQWWRLFTAVTLHENLAHLAGNATTGFLLLGLAMARYGAGIALLTAFLAGVAGNLAGVFIYPSNYASLGASGMVTGALGMLSVQAFSLRREQPFARPLLTRAIAAGVLILVLIGFSPEADKVAHVGGFVAGAILGLALAAAPQEALHRRGLNAAGGLALALIVAGAWMLAGVK